MSAFVLAWLLYNQAAERRLSTARAQAEAAAAVVTEQLSSAAEVVNNQTGFFLASTNVTVADFRDFARRSLRDQPYVEALQFSRLVTRAERADFERELAERGYPRGIQAVSGDALVVAPEGEYYLPITMQEPAAGNELVFGLDIASRPESAELVQRAIAADGPQVGTPIRLVQSGQQAVLVYSPVYRREEPLATAAQRRAALQGVAGATFLYQEALRSIAVSPLTDQVIVSAAAGSPAEAGEVLTASPGLSPSELADVASWPVSHAIDYGGWHARIYTRPAGRGLASSMAIAIGFLLAALVGLGVAYLLRSAQHRRVRVLAGQLAVANEDLVFRNTHDVLTGLLTRERASDVLTAWMAELAGAGRTISALFIDLDRFGGVNGNWGHSEGDRVLQQIGWQLAALVDDHTIASRVGGDAFLLLRRGGAPDEEPTNGRAQDSRALAERVQAAVAEPVLVRQTKQTFTCSVGIAAFPQDAATADELIAHADAAVRAGKIHGPSQITAFNQAVAATESERGEIERVLALALREPESNFALVYQPQVDMVSGSLVGMEALVRLVGRRWPPAKFIPVVESSGLIGVLGTWVMEESLAQVARWRARGLPVPPVSVNVSTRQLVDTPFDVVAAESLERHGLEPGALRLEVTESAVMDDGSAEVLARARLSGVPLSIDDFGTGYSSLSRLATLSVDDLKIDASFVAMLPSDEEAFEIVRFMADLGRVYGLTVIAEGVETTEQARVLIDAGVRIAQGYLYSTPLDVTEMGVYLQDAAARGRVADSTVPKAATGVR
ncbi:MAG: putative bifunctional diguanylate cyclase/phosphodiesterase [Candidatus Nanopelagicales bacterium]